MASRLIGVHQRFAELQVLALGTRRQRGAHCKCETTRNEEQILRDAFTEYAAYVARTPRLIAGAY